MAFVQARGRARVSARHPEARGTCDRCGFVYTHNDLSWQFDWRGSQLANLRLLVCPTCLDDFQPQLRTYVVPPDPIPISNPRPELDAGWPMETFPLYDNQGRLVRDNNGAVITVTGTEQ